LPARSIASINLSVPNVVATVLGVVPKLRAQLPALRDAVVRFDFELVEQLEEWALVLNRLHAAALVPEQPSAISNAEIEEARQLRRLLAGDATTLAGRGLLSKSEVAAIGSGNGFLKLSQDLRKLHRLFVSNAAALRGRCAVTEVELARALKLSDKLQALIIQRAQPRPHSGAELERRAFTRLMAAYREARAGIVFLRRNEGDYDDIIPSLYVGRKRRTISKSDSNARNQQTSAAETFPTESGSQ
jgi:hypothetical protein